MKELLMSDHLKNYGVPLGDNKRSGIMMPLSSHRFRIKTALESVMANAETVHVDFKNNKITVAIRATIQGADMEQAIRFGNRCYFGIDALDGATQVLFSLLPHGLELESHDLEFSYARAKLMHQYVFTFKQMDVQYLIPAEGDAVKDVRFPTPQEAMAELERAKKNKVDSTTGKQILMEDTPASKTVTIMEDPIERGFDGC